MKFLLGSFIAILIINVAYPSEIERKELEKEIKRLEVLKEEILELNRENLQLLKKIESERKALEKKEREFQRLLEFAKEERFKKLARVFEKMEPEMAGEKLSKMEEKDAAYILLNMKDKAAGNALNFVDPDRVNRIVKILTQINNATLE